VGEGVGVDGLGWDVVAFRDAGLGDCAGGPWLPEVLLAFEPLVGLCVGAVPAVLPLLCVGPPVWACLLRFVPPGLRELAPFGTEPTVTGIGCDAPPESCSFPGSVNTGYQVPGPA
jgi:hypothetical protein